jgi:hypothetical protein
MIITNLAELKTAKDKIKQELEDLHKSNEKRRVLVPTANGQKAEKKLYVVESIEAEREIKAAIESISHINQSITDFSAKGRKRNNISIPAYYNNVALIRIWVNDAISSRAITKDKILSCLTRSLGVTERYDTAAHKLQALELKKEIEFFKECDEENYILRSVAAQDVTLRLYYENMDDERIRLTTAGIFISGEAFIRPKILIPNPAPEKEGKLKARSIYKDLMNIPYSGAPNALLFKKSDSDHAKNQLNIKHLP